MTRASEVAAATLAALPGMRPSTLRSLLAARATPESVLATLADGATDATPGIDPALVARWRALLDVVHRAVTDRFAVRGTRVLLPGDVDWPIPDAPDLAPALLLAEGDRFEALGPTRPRVAVVGTRHPTPHGVADAREIAGLLADAGATVVSGLAFGIDAAAHEGTIDAGGLTIGVAATGLDVVSPAAHARLWERVRANGLIMSEHPFGTAAHPGRFPVRNRIIAAMCEVVVIVEAAITGGAMGTARLASDLHREVFAVPGSRRNPVAEGCNHLIAQGAHCLTDPLDLTVAVGRAVERSRHPAADPTRVPLGADATATLAAFGGEPATLDQLVERVRRPVGAIAGAVRELERAGRVRRSGGRLWPM